MNFKILPNFTARLLRYRLDAWLSLITISPFVLPKLSLSLTRAPNLARGSQINTFLVRPIIRRHKYFIWCHRSLRNIFDLFVHSFNKLFLLSLWFYGRFLICGEPLMNGTKGLDILRGDPATLFESWTQFWFLRWLHAGSLINLLLCFKFQ